jgi:hypothetical protein
MNKLLAPTLVLSSLLLVACAQTRDYTPPVDSRTSSPNATANYDRDIQEMRRTGKTSLW